MRHVMAWTVQDTDTAIRIRLGSNIYIMRISPAIYYPDHTLLTCKLGVLSSCKLNETTISTKRPCFVLYRNYVITFSQSTKQNKHHQYRLIRLSFSSLDDNIRRSIDNKYTALVYGTLNVAIIQKTNREK